MGLIKSIINTAKGSVFSDLTVSITNDVMNASLQSAKTAFNHLKGDSGLVFNIGDKSNDLYVYAIKRDLSQVSFATLNNIYSKLARDKEFIASKSITSQNNKSMRTIIDKHEKSAKYKVNKNLKAAPMYLGKIADECLVMWIAADKDSGGKDFEITQNGNTYYDKIKKASYKPKELGDTSLFPTRSQKYNVDSKQWEFYTNDTNVVIKNAECVFMDLGAIVSVQSANNIVVTRVQGRNGSRKEFISGGDINFSVQGKIYSNFPDLYPYEEVSKFIKIMQSDTIIQVSNLMFSQYNVSRILIKDFNMNQNEGFKNVQPYSFTCIGIEPDEDVEAITSDTIDTINYKLNQSGKAGWTQALVNKVKKASVDTAIQTLEELTTNII